MATSPPSAAAPPVASRLPRNHTWIRRSAKLFESGDYPDKSISVTPEDLDALAAEFAGPVRLLIEHAESPLELGFLTQVWRDGHELFGAVALTPEANALVERSGARSLSLGLSPDLRAIREVSLVRHPRVADAQLFAEEGPRFEGRLDAISRRAEDAARQVREFLAQGRLCPAQARLAQSLLEADASIEFDGAPRSLRELMISMIERQPPMALFGESAPASTEGAEHLLTPEETAFYRRHFPDVRIEEIAKRR